MTKDELIKDIKSHLNIKQLDQLKEKYNQKYPSTDGRLKYFKLDLQLDEKVTTALSLNLHNQKQLKLLDISTGMGYFPYICKHLGHHISITDQNDDIYDDVLNTIFDIKEKIIFTYPKFKFINLPTNIDIFDIITAMSVVPMSFWKINDWENFIQDSFKHIKSNGILYISPNYSEGLNQLILTVKNKKHVAYNNCVKLIKYEN